MRVTKYDLLSQRTEVVRVDLLVARQMVAVPSSEAVVVRRKAVRDADSGLREDAPIRNQTSPRCR